MATIEYSVAGQQITVTQDAKLVENTIGIYTVGFTFDVASWGDFTQKTAVFVHEDYPDTPPYEVPIDDGEAPIPAAVLKYGNIMIGVYGSTQTQQYPTIWAPAKRVWPGAGPGVEPPEDPAFGMVVRTAPQELTAEQQSTARTNIGAAPAVVPDSTPGDVAIIGSNSNISDSGISKDNLLIAPQLASNNIKTDSIPYVYRQTGGGIGVGNREYDSIVGGSLVWDQKAPILPEGSYTSNGITCTKNSDGSIIINGTATANFFINGAVAHGINGHVCLVRGCPHGGSSTTFYLRDGYTSQRFDTGNGVLVKKTSDNILAQINVLSGTTVSNVVFKPQIYDLTQMFGTAVAEKLYAMGDDGLNLFNSWFPEAYYPYTATPSLESVSGLSSHQMKDGNGNVIAEYPLDSSLTLRGVAVLDDNNNIKFDGDEYAPDGTVTRKYQEIDLSTLTWSYNSATDRWISGTVSGIKNVTGTALAHLLAENYPTFINNTLYDNGLVGIAVNATALICRTGSSSASPTGKAIIELATPTIETAEPYDAVQICDPLGTEEYVTTGICPVGHSTRYPEDSVKKLSGLPSDFSTLIAPTEVTYKATRAYTTGRLLIVDNILYKATTSIASGATLTVGTNITATTLDEVIASL